MDSETREMRLRARRLAVLDEFRRLVESYPEVVATVQDTALQNLADGRRFGFRAIVEQLRWLDLMDGRGRVLRITNDMSIVFGVLMVNKWPELRSVVHVNRGGKYAALIAETGLEWPDMATYGRSEG